MFLSANPWPWEGRCSCKLGVSRHLCPWFRQKVLNPEDPRGCRNLWLPACSSLFKAGPYLSLPLGRLPRQGGCSWAWEGLAGSAQSYSPRGFQLPAGQKPATKTFPRRREVLEDLLHLREGARLGGRKEDSGPEQGEPCPRLGGLQGVCPGLGGLQGVFWPWRLVVSW